MPNIMSSDQAGLQLIYIGSYETAEQAALAYNETAARLGLNRPFNIVKERDANGSTGKLQAP